MPIPSGFPQVTDVFIKPPGWSDEECGPLPLFTDGARFVSKWSFSHAEIKELEKTMELWVTIWGSGQPPMSLDVLPVLNPVPEGIYGELNGSCCPSCSSAKGFVRRSFVWVTEEFDWSANPLTQVTGPHTSVTACAECGLHLQFNDVSAQREETISRACYGVSGLKRETNESMRAYQDRLLRHFGDDWPAMLDAIVQRVYSGETQKDSTEL